MLQRIRAHTQGWMAWAVLATLAFVFTLWGVSGELITNPGEKTVAKVAGGDITERELHVVTERLTQQNQMAQIMAGIQAPVINKEAVRKQALDSLVIERVLTHAARSEGFLVTPEQVNEILIKLPQFQVNGEFSPAVYDRVIRQMNFTPESFRETVLSEMLITQAQSTIQDSAFVLPYQLNEVVGLVNQKRDIQYALFDANTFASQVKLTPQDLEAYYNSHQSEFMTDETVTLAYVELDKNMVADKVRKTMHPTDAQLLQDYEDKIARFSSPETRSAKHILVSVKPGAKPEERDQAKAKAESILAELKNGASFAELAKKDSDDPGSASQGGDLGTFGRGEMVPEFESAVFGHNTGDLVGPVKTDFGYHIILVGPVKPATAKPFNLVKDTLAKEWVEDRVVDEFEKAVNELDQTAFENPDSLDKVSEVFHLPVKQLTLFADPIKNDGLAKNPKIHDSTFSEDVLFSHKNSEALHISPDSVIVLRVLQHQIPALKPFDSVRYQLDKSMTERQALFLAREKANTILEEFNKGASPAELAKKEGFTWTVMKGVSRQGSDQLPPDVVKAAFGIPQNGKPAMAGAELPSRGSALVVVDAIHPGEMDPQYAKSMTADYTSSLEQFKGVRDFNFYVATAKEKAKVKIEP